MKINGVELDNLEIYDADVAERYEKALDDVIKKSEDIQGLKTSAIIRKQCECVFKFFNTMFGECTDKKIFGDKVNLLTCLKAFEELVEQVNAQKGEVEKIASKYSPNRAQRRKK